MSMKASTANVVGAYDAKTHFSELLERVAGGEVITITRHGAPVARLVPAGLVSSVDSRREAVLAMRRIADRNRLGGLRVKDLITEGRR